MNNTHSMPARVKQVHITDHFWTYYQKLLRDTVLPYQWEALNDRIEGAQASHCFHNLKVAAGMIQGEYEGPVFQDHGILTWLEAAGAYLAQHPDAELEALADEAIDLLAQVQQEDGYLNSYFIVNAPEKRWTNLMECHELFCAGHLIEAAVAYKQGTGKDKFLNIAVKYADYIDSVFGPEEGKCKGYPGHQEIELALLKLFRETGNPRYRKLAEFFINQRGTKPYYFEEERKKRGGETYWPSQECMTPSYFQAHEPVREQKTAVGHAVRAVYQYAAMAELAAETKDEELAAACRILFDDITGKQMYITGGVGATHVGEAFTSDYDLPNDTVYQETCASIGLVIFASRMLMLEQDSRYADIMERSLYNSVISGIARDGKSFFYVNPMETWPEADEKNPDRMHIKGTRQPWFSCACCPPNIARTIASVGQYLYSVDQNGVYVNLYAGSTFDFSLGGRNFRLMQEEDYLRSGRAAFTVQGEESGRFLLALRKPGWTDAVDVTVNGIVQTNIRMKNGYILLEREWENGDRAEIKFAVKVRVMRANPLVRADAGKIALMRGPLVYCLEEKENGKNLSAVSIPANQTFETGVCPELDETLPVIYGNALREDEAAWQGEALYAPVEKRIPVKFCAVPYALWGNRGKGEMMVWIRQGSLPEENARPKAGG